MSGRHDKLLLRRHSSTVVVFFFVNITIYTISTRVTFKILDHYGCLDRVYKSEPYGIKIIFNNRYYDNIRISDLRMRNNG